MSSTDKTKENIPVYQVTVECVFQHADILPPGHRQIPQVHQQPAEAAAPDSECKTGFEAWKHILTQMFALRVYLVLSLTLGTVK